MRDTPKDGPISITTWPNTTNQLKTSSLWSMELWSCKLMPSRLLSKVWEGADPTAWDPCIGRSMMSGLCSHGPQLTFTANGKLCITEEEKPTKMLSCFWLLKTMQAATKCTSSMKYYQVYLLVWQSMLWHLMEQTWDHLLSIRWWSLVIHVEQTQSPYCFLN